MKITSLRALFLYIQTSLLYAATFSIVPLAHHDLPTVINTGESAYAFYTVTNNTKQTLAGIHITYLPDGVSQVTTGSVPNLCGSTFSLSPNGSCTLELLVNAVVSATNPNPHQHIFLCLPGNTTCSGTPFPLATQLSHWVDTQLPVQSGDVASTLAMNGATVYVAGMGYDGFPRYWTYTNGAWSTTSPIAHGVTGAYAKISTMQAASSGGTPFLYLGVSGVTQAWVFRYLSSVSTDTNLPTLQDAGPLSIVQASAYDASGNFLYVAGLGKPSNDDFSVYGGRVYYYDGNTWTQTTPSVGANLSFSNFTSLFFSQNTLYLAGYGVYDALSGPQIAMYSRNTNTWTPLGIVITEDNSIAVTINSIVVNGAGMLFAGGVDRNNLGVVWRYVSSTWQKVSSIPNAQSVLSLALNQSDQLYAAGLCTGGVGCVWAYDSASNTWNTLTIAQNASVSAIAFDTNNRLYALGTSIQHVFQLWYYQ